MGSIYKVGIRVSSSMPTPFSLIRSFISAVGVGIYCQENGNGR